MKKQFVILLSLFVLSLSAFGQIDNILGRWKTIDDSDGEAKSIVYIFKATNGKYYGKIEKLFKNPDAKCTECTGANKDKPTLGLIIINDMVLKNESLTGGTILDPKNGKVYRCNISYDKKKGTLSVRGSLDKSGFLGRTQTWHRVN